MTCRLRTDVAEVFAGDGVIELVELECAVC